MSESVIVKTLETVLAHVKSVVPECECRRSYASESDLTKLGKLGKPLVSVILADKEEKPLDRETKETTFKVLLVLQRKLENTSNNEKVNEEVDPLMELLERLFSAFFVAVTLQEPATVSPVIEVVCKRPEHGSNPSMYYADEIIRNNHFLGTLLIEVVTITRR